MRNIIFLTGAGLSCPSGLPSFRNDPHAFWVKYDPDEVCHALHRRSKAHFDFMNVYRHIVNKCHPNHAHCWIATLQRNFGSRVAVYTTNIDDLHEMAGTVVTHLHGCVANIRCEECGVRVRKGLSYTLYGDDLCVVGCRLGAMMRNDVVLFDEDTTKEYRGILRELQDATDTCVFVVIGCSFTTYDWHRVVTRATKVLVDVDRELCEQMRDHFTYVICGDISQAETLRMLEDILSSRDDA